MSLKNKLNRFKSHMVRDTDQSKSPEKKLTTETPFSFPFAKKWEEAGATTYSYDDQFCFIREVRYPIHYQHGSYTFRDCFEAIQLWQSYAGDHPLSGKGLDMSDLFFFDTETTGLHDGAGNTIFLLGYALFEGQEVVVRQHFLPEPGNEVALYKSFLERVDYTTLVTYNGKSFDWPRVKTQHTLVRTHVPKLPAFGHFDLYHAARRLWKNILESVKLANVEKEILNIKRKDDVPGYLAPMIYFDFVERKDPEGIIQVLKHNEIDILSLITLYTHLTFQINGKDPSQTKEEKLLIGKWFNDIGEKEIATSNFELAAKAGNISATHQLAFLQKRNKLYAKAKESWKIVIEKGSTAEKREAYIELAKLMEHQFKDFDQALKFTEKAISIPFEASFTEAKVQFFNEQGKKRLNRIHGKLARNH